MAEQNQTKPKFRTSIGGQALIEGILMRGPEKQAIVVRSKEGLVEKVEELKLIRDRYPILGLPVLRGAVTFVDSMVRGVKALMYSADFFPEEEGEPSKLDLWLEKKLGSEKLQKLVVALAVVLSLGLTIGLFMILPTFLAGLLGRFIPNVVIHNLVESVIKLLIFFGYLLLCSKQKDIQRVFQYHGAEHKTIFCYEAGLPHRAAPPSALRHELSVRGGRGVHPRFERGVQLRRLAQCLGAHRIAPAAARAGRGRDL